MCKVLSSLENQVLILFLKLIQEICTGSLCTRKWENRSLVGKSKNMCLYFHRCFLVSKQFHLPDQSQITSPNHTLSYIFSPNFFNEFSPKFLKLTEIFYFSPRFNCSLLASNRMQIS